VAGEASVFKLLGQRKTKEREEKAAEEQPAAKEVLDEEQVVDLVSRLSGEYGISLSASVRSILKAAIRSADQIVESIKIRARAEAEEEAARIIAQAKKEAEEIRKGLATTVEKEAEEILSAAEEAVEEKEGAGDEPAEEKALSEVAPEAERDREEELSALKRGKGSLYAGEVELVLGVPMDPNLVAKLYNYLQMTPEIKFVRTSGSWNRGATITVTVDKPIPLVSVLSSKLPEAAVTPAPPEKGDLAKKGKGVRRINIALKGS
jgi:hypothetical protein